MRLTSVRCLVALVGISALPACGGTKYQCDVYSLSSGTRVSTTWYDASDAGEAEATCEGENSPLDCECYEDN